MFKKAVKLIRVVIGVIAVLFTACVFIIGLTKYKRRPVYITLYDDGSKNPNIF